MNTEKLFQITGDYVTLERILDRSTQGAGGGQRGEGPPRSGRSVLYLVAVSHPKRRWKEGSPGPPPWSLGCRLPGPSAE